MIHLGERHATLTRRDGTTEVIRVVARRSCFKAHVHADVVIGVGDRLKVGDVVHEVEAVATYHRTQRLRLRLPHELPR